MNLKAFLISFILVYIVLSAPAIVGIGLEIEWVSEATWIQKFKGTVIDGLLEYFLLKAVIASIVGFVVSIVKARGRSSH
ncbi:hypothetical protein [Paucisalibacillus globulus]|uniref:hypothetical protein n=1 Tax=Paucisalibacillus globulus TaxID=351095 RepID=UPI000BB758FD|nr:hypothetical protein [Paucisalibacillus globulus]